MPRSEMGDAAISGPRAGDASRASPALPCASVSPHGRPYGETGCPSTVLLSRGRRAAAEPVFSIASAPGGARGSCKSDPAQRAYALHGLARPRDRPSAIERASMDPRNAELRAADPPTSRRRDEAPIVHVAVGDVHS